MKDEKASSGTTCKAISTGGSASDLRGTEPDAMRDTAILNREAILQSVSETKNTFASGDADTSRRDLRADYVFAKQPFSDTTTKNRHAHSI